MKMNSTLLMTLLFIMHSAYAAQECASLTREINKENMNHYKALVQKSLSQKVSLDKIDITQILSEHEWVALSVSTEIAEPGVMFFKNNSFVDVWGGDVFPQDKAKVLTWSKGIHAPEKLAHCFYSSVVIK